MNPVDIHRVTIEEGTKEIRAAVNLPHCFMGIAWQPVVLIIIEPILLHSPKLSGKAHNCRISVGWITGERSPHILSNPSEQRFTRRLLVVAAVIVAIPASP
ncbi:hypothetical protein D3C81_2104580 [compost metagenome]